MGSHRFPRSTFHVAVAAVAATLAATLAVATLARAELPRARRISDARLGISAEAPPGWTIGRRTGFAETVFLFLFPDGSRISLSAEKTTARSTNELIEQNRQGLSRQGFVVGRTATGPGDWYSLDLDVPGRGEKLRQLYQVRSVANEKQALVLTLVSSATTFAFHRDAVAFVVDRMTMDAPTSPPSATPGAPVTKRDAATPNP